MQIVLALVITIVSACCLNLGYLINGAASKLPPLSMKRPVASVRMLLRNPRWLLGFGIEGVGWGLYVLALALAPLSIVQAAAAGGIGILAVMVSRITRVPLTRLERIGAVVSVGGLALLGVSLLGGHEDGTKPDIWWVVGWLLVSAALAGTAIRILPSLIGGGPAWGIAAGILFRLGDVATKMTVEGGSGWPAFLVCLIAAYTVGTFALQSGFQQAGALTTAGIATLLTNALPIVAGMTIFDELGLTGWKGVLRVVAFVAVVVGAVLLSARTKAVDIAEGEAAAARAAEDESPLHPNYA